VDTSDENAAELGNHRDMSLAGSFWRWCYHNLQ
jgi:hypothetical protein